MKPVCAFLRPLQFPTWLSATVITLLSLAQTSPLPAQIVVPSVPFSAGNPTLDPEFSKTPNSRTPIFLKALSPKAIPGLFDEMLIAPNLKFSEPNSIPGWAVSRIRDQSKAKDAALEKLKAATLFEQCDENAQDRSSDSQNSACRAPSLKELPRHILRDQKFFWARPFRLERADAPWAATLVGISAALIATDARVGRGLSDSPPGSGFAFSRRVSQFGGGPTDVGVAALFYWAGHLRSNERARATGLLGFRALANSFMVVESLKTATQRPRPTRDGGRLRNHDADGEFFTGGRSFPSGHAIESWSLATVVACQYRHRRWVAAVAYSLAGLVSVARVGQRKHFPSDAFVGGALGYLIGRHVCTTNEYQRKK